MGKCQLPSTHRVFFKGEIIGCRLNAPGSWHDSRVAHPIYKKLLEETPEGYYLVADTAFPRGLSQIEGRIRTSIKAGDQLPANIQERNSLLAFNNQLTSFRQTSEWGMRLIQGSFARLRVPLDINRDSDRADLIEVCVRLCNYRTRTVGHNQIKTVYMSIWREGHEQERIWKEFEHIVFGEQRSNDRVHRFYLESSA
ncbi:hypothetical protein BT96DRAFT_939881 [Gymnopus androsaceus JB14]|uniref:DDE Tnp4 domain-containing protein n=1 Tax=Gymnopus androsaceus JB14 TaxID=1447944 RepID=A0A6A4HM72_9AGAR|nr:hypothetical protein BT96DRAFT_939881 [Gymnopus androsaceus JB14]